MSNAPNPLPYESPALQLRPGIVTAMGVASIVVASLSVLANIGSCLSAFVFLAMSRLKVPMPVATTAAATVPATMPTTMLWPFQFSVSTLVFTSLGGALGLAAAGVLLAAGIQVLRNRRSGRRLHWIFVAIKFPTELLVAVTTFFFTQSMMRNFATGVPGGAPNATSSGMAPVAMFQAIFYAALSLAYPIVLLVLLRSRTAREYFDRLTNGE